LFVTIISFRSTALLDKSANACVAFDGLIIRSAPIYLVLSLTSLVLVAYCPGASSRNMVSDPGTVSEACSVFPLLVPDTSNRSNWKSSFCFFSCCAIFGQCREWDVQYATTGFRLFDLLSSIIYVFRAAFPISSFLM